MAIYMGGNINNCNHNYYVYNLSGGKDLLALCVGIMPTQTRGSLRTRDKIMFEEKLAKVVKHTAAPRHGSHFLSGVEAQKLGDR